MHWDHVQCFKSVKDDLLQTNISINERKEKKNKDNVIHHCRFIILDSLMPAPSDSDTWNTVLPRDVLMVNSAKWNHSMFHTSLKNDEMSATSCDSNSLHFSAFQTGWRVRRACDRQDDTAPGWSRWWWDISLVWLMFVCGSLSASLSR